MNGSLPITRMSTLSMTAGSTLSTRARSACIARVPGRGICLWESGKYGNLSDSTVPYWRSAACRNVLIVGFSVASCLSRSGIAVNPRTHFAADR